VTAKGLAGNLEANTNKPLLSKDAVLEAAGIKRRGIPGGAEIANVCNEAGLWSMRFIMERK